MSHRRSVTLRPAGRSVGVCGLEAILVLRSVSYLDIHTGIVPEKKINSKCGNFQQFSKANLQFGGQSSALKYQVSLSMRAQSPAYCGSPGVLKIKFLISFLEKRKVFKNLTCYSFKWTAIWLICSQKKPCSGAKKEKNQQKSTKFMHYYIRTLNCQLRIRFMIEIEVNK